MSKLLLVLLVIALVGAIAWTWRRQREGLGRDRAPRLRAMVACAHCGLHIPASEALMLDDRPYCSAGHRDAGPEDPR
jgi:uncharacterized protein